MYVGISYMSGLCFKIIQGVVGITEKTKSAELLTVAATGLVMWVSYARLLTFMVKVLKNKKS